MSALAAARIIRGTHFSALIELKYRKQVQTTPKNEPNIFVDQCKDGGAMWNFFKKIADAIAPVDAPLPLSQEFMRDITLVSQGSANFSLYYANLCGYQRSVSNEDDPNFRKIITGEPTFTEVGRQYAVKRLIGIMDIFCKSDPFEKIVLANKKNLSNEDIDELRKFKKIVLRHGFENICDGSGLNLREFIQNEAIRRRNADIETITSKLEEHKAYLKPLLMKALARSKNKYGESDFSQYIKELRDFLNHFLPQGGFHFFSDRTALDFCIDHVVDWFRTYGDGISIPLDGVAFEYWCAERIREQGWAVQVSKSSGDQGVDIEAMKEDRFVVVQCKRYDQPVGNKAVQEVYAGKAHYGANVACVIATCGFTASAEELARSAGVILLDAQTIDEFTDVIESKC